MPDLTFSGSEYDAVLRNDLHSYSQRCFFDLVPGAAFEANFHLEVIASDLQKTLWSEPNRLMINVPPRHLKSHMASVAFPTFILGHDPSARIMCVSYGQDLADKFSRDRLTIMRSPWHQRLFSTRLSPDRQAVSEFVTTEHGYCLATSIGGSVTGLGADYIIIDDPQKPEDTLSEAQRRRVNDYIANTLYSRLDDKQKGRMIVIMQRLHEDDLVGHLSQQEGWTHRVFPAIAEKDETFVINSFFGPRTIKRKIGDVLHARREPLELLEQIRQQIGPYNFAGQYQQAPTPLGGGLVKADCFVRYAQNERPSTFDQIIQSWDTATKATELSNYSVCTTWGVIGKHIYLLNVFRKQLEYPSLKRAVLEQQALFGATIILIEDKSSGTQLIQELIAEEVYGIQACKPDGDKIMRMNAQTALIENGLVHIPANAHWLEQYLTEITTFPRSKYDDQVDSTSQALDWIKRASWIKPDPVLEFYKRQHEDAVNRPNAMVRVRAPAGITQFYIGNGPTRTVGEDGTIELSEELALILIGNGWSRVE